MQSSMFDLVWHLRGSVLLDESVADEVALDRISCFLGKQRKNVSERGTDYLGFKEPQFGGAIGNWRALVMYEQGRFWIEKGLSGRTLRYDLRSLHVLVFCLAGVVMFFGIGCIVDGVIFGFKVAAGMFAWLYGMNIILALLRVPLSIRSAIRRD